MTARLVILYGHPDDAAAFEDYYASTHIPYAVKHMPNVRDAQNSRVVELADGSRAPYYRVSQMSYDDLAALRAGIESEDGRSTIADLANFATGGATLLVVEDD
ncbi:EthD family reductase [Pseudonocardia phyllosphaerae]|uniref:EthD family reductase n=1 Tax=Pseudonocardia phyllosphaerae TaxID=3390502 RepID=UPI00397E64AB